MKIRKQEYYFKLNGNYIIKGRRGYAKKQMSHVTILISLMISIDSKMGERCRRPVQGADVSAGATFPVVPGPWLIAIPLSRVSTVPNTAPDSNTKVRALQKHQ